MHGVLDAMCGGYDTAPVTNPTTSGRAYEACSGRMGGGERGRSAKAMLKGEVGSGEKRWGRGGQGGRNQLPVGRAVLQGMVHPAPLPCPNLTNNNGHSQGGGEGAGTRAREKEAGKGGGGERSWDGLGGGESEGWCQFHPPSSMGQGRRGAAVLQTHGGTRGRALHLHVHGPGGCAGGVALW